MCRGNKRWFSPLKLMSLKADENSFRPKYRASLCGWSASLLDFNKIKIILEIVQKPLFFWYFRLLKPNLIKCLTSIYCGKIYFQRMFYHLSSGI